MNLREAAETALEALEDIFGKNKIDVGAINALRTALAEAEEPDLSKCPNCGGLADNGHDRCVPPNSYHCTKCSAEEPVAWTGYNLDRMADAFARVIDAHYDRNSPFQNSINMDAALALREFRRFIPSMKAYAHPPRREPVTETKCKRAICQRASDGYCAPCHEGYYP